MIKTKWNYPATFGLAANQLLWEYRSLQSNYGPLPFLIFTSTPNRCQLEAELQDVVIKIYPLGMGHTFRNMISK